VLDLAIVNGDVVDGRGGAPRPLDIGIEGGRIAVVGERGCVPETRRTLDAAGRLVTPGFVDPHTHMDAQLWWDPSGVPSILHGVTSVVTSSCGFGVAPTAPGRDEYVLRSLESVEEIPYESTRRALPMTWTTWPEWFEAVGRLPLGVNVAAFVPHSALRFGVLGDRGLEAGLAAGEVDRLVASLRDALAAGAVGVSTSRGTNHTDATGRPVPSRLADDTELERLVATCADRIWQINIAAKGATSPAGREAALRELETYAGWSRRHATRATWTPLVVAPGDEVTWRVLLEFTSTRPELLAQTSAQPVSATIGFDGPSFAGMIDGWAPAFAGYGSLSDADRRTALHDERFRGIVRDAPEDRTRITSPCYDRWTVLVSPSSPGAVGVSIRALGDGVGRHPIDALFDLALADDLRTVVGVPLSNLDDDAVRAVVTTPSTLLGLGDAGAHIKSITNYTYPTYVLATLVRDRGWFAIGEAVRKLTAQPAEAFGLAGRGVVAEGYRADLCVVDLPALAVLPATLVADIPGGGLRLHAAATGYAAVVVNREVAVEDDRPTAARAGELIRA
jgi:N-acyl-D-aspartate/D-glutamate deacylase